MEYIALVALLGFFFWTAITFRVREDVKEATSAELDELREELDQLRAELKQTSESE